MKKWIHLIVTMLLLTALLLAHSVVVRDTLHTLPEAALASVVPTISVKEFSDFTGTVSVSPVLTQSGYAETQSVTAYYTTADAPALFGITMQYGNFEPWQDGNIVISNQLAVALFLTDNAVGQTVTFNGRPYTVCGVYAQPDSLLARVSQTPAPVVFLPVTAYPDQTVGVEKLLLGLTDVPSTASVAVEFETLLDVRLTYRSAYHFDETRRLAIQSEKMLLFLLAITFCGLSGWWTAQLAARLIKSSKADSYRNIFTGNKQTTFFFIAALLCFIAGIFWISNSTFSLFLPQDFITKSGSITDYIIENFQLGNLESHFFLCEFSSNLKVVLALLDICIVVVLLKFVYQVKKRIDPLLGYKREMRNGTNF